MISLKFLNFFFKSTSTIKFCDLSVSEIAEQMTYIDYQIFCSISCQELLGQAWMKPGKEFKAKNILLFSKRFNEVKKRWLFYHFSDL